MRMRSGVQVWAWSAAAAGFLFGLDVAVTGGAEQAVQRTWALGPAAQGFAVSAGLWGTALGALGASVPMDRFGRKPVIIAAMALYAICALTAAHASDPITFMAVRALGGLALGLSTVAAPAYISEIAPRKDRGRLVTLFQLMLVLGILAGMAGHLAVADWPMGWRFMFALPALAAALALIGLALAPESPRWLALRGRTDEARAVLVRINPITVDDTLALLATEPHGQLGLKRFLFGPYGRPILLAVLLALFNQLSGINAVMYYTPRLFELAGADARAARLATLGVGAINVLFTLVGLALIDRAGRRALLTAGSIGYVASLSVLALGFAVGNALAIIIGVFAFVASHAVGQGAILWVYIAEIFPNRARASGQALATGVLWIGAALMTLVVPGLLASVPPERVFGAFAVFMLAQLVFARVLMVETRGRSLESVADELAPSDRDESAS